jgi:hypothetical protein
MRSIRIINTSEEGGVGCRAFYLRGLGRHFKTDLPVLLFSSMFISEP